MAKKQGIAYIRARKFDGKWTPDAELQAHLIQSYAEVDGVDIAKTVIEEQTFSLRRKDTQKELMPTLSECRRKKMTFYYVDIGRWRRNPVFSEVMTALDERDKTGKIKRVGIPATQEILDAIARQSEFEKALHSHRAIPRKRERQTITRVEEFQRDRAIGTKRMRNYQHLYKGVEPIYKVFWEQRDQMPSTILKALHDGQYLTSDKKLWTKENVRRTRRLVEGQDFKDFVAMMNEEKAD